MAKQIEISQYMTKHMNTCTKRGQAVAGNLEEVAITSLHPGSLLEKMTLKGWRKEEKCCPGTCISGLLGVYRLLGNDLFVLPILP